MNLGNVTATMFGGFYSLDASEAGDVATIQNELESTTAAMYYMATSRLEVAINTATPHMVEQLKDDATYAAMYTRRKPEYERAMVGASNAVARSTTASLMALRAATSPWQRQAYMYTAERTMYAAATLVSGLNVLSRGGEYEAWRKQAATGMEYLFGDLELFTKVRGISDALIGVGSAATYAATKDAMDAQAHKLTMQSIEWDKKRRAKKLDDTSSDAGNLTGMVFQGLLDGLGDARKNMGA